MNNLLIDYCKSRLTDSNYKPEYKEVTNASFAKFRDFEVDGSTTGYADYKLLTSKLKRDYLEDKYGRVLFKTVIEE